jgi:hypothetical protein
VRHFYGPPVSRWAPLRLSCERGFAINLESRTLPHVLIAAYTPPSPPTFPDAHAPTRFSGTLRMALDAARARARVYEERGVRIFAGVGGDCAAVEHEEPPH